FAGGSALGPAVVTAEFKINYVRPALGELLIAKATAVYAGKRQAVCRCDLISVSEGRESLCALAQATITALAQGPNDGYLLAPHGRAVGAGTHASILACSP